MSSTGHTHYTGARPRRATPALVTLALTLAAMLVAVGWFLGSAR